ncbi:hypothetical protein L211DRAFT_533950 [Terfezia boudieri ATCC MYA-4762]|uniref:Uncharacterized protein n=1 Tax=Terfezia boudieri ATCC MYA-4762 TaxID=1051890 RepID=A0A3N4LWM1_9PEZI|nr:hypothetical protein L211DRAFT_533950 [Terfezia boudieri ATCC MYA-4762]
MPPTLICQQPPYGKNPHIPLTSIYHRPPYATYLPRGSNRNKPYYYSPNKLKCLLLTLRIFRNDNILVTTTNVVNEPETEPLPPPWLHPQAALAYIEELLLFSLHAEPTPNITELQDVFKREKYTLKLLRFSAEVFIY